MINSEKYSEMELDLHQFNDVLFWKNPYDFKPNVETVQQNKNDPNLNQSNLNKSP